MKKKRNDSSLLVEKWDILGSFFSFRGAPSGEILLQDEIDEGENDAKGKEGDADSASVSFLPEAAKEKAKVVEAAENCQNDGAADYSPPPPKTTKSGSQGGSSFCKLPSFFFSM